MNIYQFSAKTINNEVISLEKYEGYVLLIVNIASECGFTPQLSSLQTLYNKFKDEGFIVLGFPCNQFANQTPGTNEAVHQFCQINYKITFPIFSKVKVKGKEAHPLFQYLTRNTKGFLTDSIKWNFTKFLVDRKGNVVERFAPQTKPERLQTNIEMLIK